MSDAFQNCVRAVWNRRLSDLKQQAFCRGTSLEDMERAFEAQRSDIEGDVRAVLNELRLPTAQMMATVRLSGDLDVMKSIIDRVLR